MFQLIVFEVGLLLTVCCDAILLVVVVIAAEDVSWKIFPMTLEAIKCDRPGRLCQTYRPPHNNTSPKIVACVLSRLTEWPLESVLTRGDGLV